MRRVWLAGLLTVALTGCGTSLVSPSVEVPTFEDGPPMESEFTATDTAADALQELRVAEKSQAVEYNRQVGFGEPWEDVDENGCDTRNDVLARDLQMVAYKDDCVVAAGLLTDPYTGKTIEFVRGAGTSRMVQIDHVVSLSDAWRSGSWDDPYKVREELANDPMNLLAVDGPTNASKSDSDASEWLPPVESYHCAYVARQIAVKTVYDLSVTPSEKVAMLGVLRACPGEKLPSA